MRIIDLSQAILDLSPDTIVLMSTSWVNIGIDHDTAAFAVAGIRTWWLSIGTAIYPAAEEITFERSLNTRVTFR